MFDNIGGKIKKLAKIVAIGGIAGSIFIGMCIFAIIPTQVGSLVGFVISAIGSSVSWIGSFAAYGYGQLIENSDKAVRFLEGSGNRISYSEDINKKEPVRGATEPPKAPPVPEVKRAFFDRKDPNTRVICPHCNTVQRGDNERCTCCGATFIYRQMS